MLISRGNAEIRRVSVRASRDERDSVCRRPRLQIQECVVAKTKDFEEEEDTKLCLCAGVEDLPQPKSSVRTHIRQASPTEDVSHLCQDLPLMWRGFCGQAGMPQNRK